MANKFLLSFCVIGSLITHSAFGQTSPAITAYIEKYKDWAIQEQLRTGIPASIKLAQGILETASGNSELCNNANNHFGIKCKGTWVGDTYTYTDDAKDECFRKYNDAYQSYKDHSDFLVTNKRYSSLFSIPKSDYTSWAKELKRCGYATNPIYAQKLIKLIEDNNLQQYTIVADYASYQNTEAFSKSTSYVVNNSPYITTTDFNNPLPAQDSTSLIKRVLKKGSGDVFGNEQVAENVENASFTPTQYNNIKAAPYKVNTYNGLKGFYAKAGDMLLEQAVKYNIRYSKLLELNDLEDEPLPADMFIYLEKKRKTGVNNQYKVQNGDLLIEIAQKESIQLSQLRAYNHLIKGEEPAEGVILNLQSNATSKPEISRFSFMKPNKIEKAAESGYIASNNSVVEKTNSAINRVQQVDSKATIISSDVKDEYVKGGKTVKEVAKVAENTVNNSIEQTSNIKSENATLNKLAALESTVNIADETAVEEAAFQEPQSSIDKLKAQMDKSFYGGQTATKQVVNNSTNKVSQTTKQTTAKVVKSINEEDDFVTTPASAQDRLKRNIEAYQASNQVEKPIVAAQTSVSNNASNNTVSDSKYHTVEKGDTAFNISKRYNITVDQLLNWNNLGSPSIQLGQKLKVKP